MKSPTPSQRAARLSSVLFEMGRLLKRDMAAAGGPGMTFLHLETLRFIKDNPSSSMSDLAEYLRVTKPTATSLVTGLVSTGIVTRREDSGDRRRILLALSSQGAHVLATAAKARERAVDRLFARLPVRDQEELLRIVSAVIHAA